MQLLNCQVLAPAKTIRATEWAGSSLCRVLRKRDPQSTDRLTQKKCQVTGTYVWSGGKTPLILLLRSGNEWRVEREGYAASLKASVGDDPTIPPTTGWIFYNKSTKAYEEDPLLMCISSPPSPSCSITVSLSGLAKEFQEDCEGEYKDTGLRSSGRKVIQFSIKSSAHLEMLSGVQTEEFC